VQDTIGSAVKNYPFGFDLCSAITNTSFRFDRNSFGCGDWPPGAIWFGRLAGDGSTSFDLRDNTLFATWVDYVIATGQTSANFLLLKWRRVSSR